MENSNKNDVRLLVDGKEYWIDHDTDAKLQEGIIPETLQNQTTQAQGKETCFEFCRQRRLMKRVCDQIKEGKQPAQIRPLVESGAVSAEILFKLYHHKLIAKAEKLYKKKLIPDTVLQTVRTHLLTPEILPVLDKAFLMETAQYLYEQKEINKDILDGIQDGSIDPQYVRIIRRYSRQLQSLMTIEKNHAFCTHLRDDGEFPYSSEFAHPDAAVDKDLLAEVNRQYLREALAWLTPAERELICHIYIDQIPMTVLADSLGVTEGTIRYRRTQILSKLRMILEDVLQLHFYSFFE